MKVFGNFWWELHSCHYCKTVTFVWNSYYYMFGNDLIGSVYFLLLSLNQSTYYYSYIHFSICIIEFSFRNFLPFSIFKHVCLSKGSQFKTRLLRAFEKTKMVFKLEDKWLLPCWNFCSFFKQNNHDVTKYSWAFTEFKCSKSVCVAHDC